MLNDNLNKRKLIDIIGTSRFNTVDEFKEAIKEKLLDNFHLDEDRLSEKPSPQDSRTDLLITDSLTKRETILLMGLKTAKDSPNLTEDDVQKFHGACKKALTLYGVLMTESETRFFHYKWANNELFIDEVDSLKPLNYVDYESERVMDKRKIQDLLMAHKKWVIGIGLFIVLIIAINLARASVCKSGGPILGNINKDGVKTYLLPGDSGYKSTEIGDVRGERRFCDEQTAIEKGWTRKK